FRPRTLSGTTSREQPTRSCLELLSRTAAMSASTLKVTGSPLAIARYTGWVGSGDHVSSLTVRASQRGWLSWVTAACHRCRDEENSSGGLASRSWGRRSASARYTTAKSAKVGTSASARPHAVFSGSRLAPIAIVASLRNPRRSRSRVHCREASGDDAVRSSTPNVRDVVGEAVCLRDLESMGVGSPRSMNEAWDGGGLRVGETTQRHPHHQGFCLVSPTLRPGGMSQPTRLQMRKS